MTKKPANPETLRRLKFGDLKRLLQRRYKGRCFPEGDDAALDDLELLLILVSLGRQSKSQSISDKMLFEVEEVAPWLAKEDADAMIDHIMRMPVAERRRLTTAEAIGKRVNLRYEEREAFGFWSIAPADISPTALADRRKAKNRARSMRARRKAGAISRKQYLSKSKSQSEPWKAAGMAKATWYRRGLHLRETSPYATSLNKASTDLSHLPCPTLARSARERVPDDGARPNRCQPVSYAHGPVSPSTGYALVPGKPAYCRTTITAVEIPDASEAEWRRKECTTK
jgi:hypothetical protein